MTSSRPVRSSKRPAISTELRVRRAVNLTRQENPLIPILLDMFESALHQGQIQENTELARIYNQFIAEKIPKEILQKTLDNYRSLSAPLKAQITPQRYRKNNTNPTAPVPPSSNTNLPKKGNWVTVSTGTVVSKNMFDSAYLAAFKDLGKITIPTFIPPDKATILKIHPKESEGYVPGQLITLQVAYPEAHSPSFKVILSDPDIYIDGNIPGQDYATISPKVLTRGRGASFGARLQIKLPKNFHSGSIRFSVLSSKGLKPLESSREPIFGKVVLTLPVSPILLDSPEITSVKPQGQLPGRKVIVEGRNIGNVKILDPGKFSNGEPGTSKKSAEATPILKLIPSTNEQNEVLLPVKIIKPSPIDGIGQLEFTIPKTCIPGDYWLQLEVGLKEVLNLSGINVEFPNGRESLVVDFKVLPHKYKVNFNSIHCIDESDPEKVVFANISDKIVTRWVIGADVEGWSKSTGEYKGFDDGDTQSYSGSDSAVFMIDNSFGEVKIALSIITDLYESDESDVQQTQAVLDLTAKTGTAVAGLLLAAGVPTGAAIAEAVAQVASGVSVFVGLMGWKGLDHLGQQQLVWSAEQLQNLTDNPNRQFLGQLNFLNSDDEGSYQLSYTVSRLE